jgi:Tfp pilus assembly protein FimT
MRFGSQELRQIPKLNCSGRAGLTITELVLGILVLALLFAIAIPRIDIGLRRAHLQGATAELTTAHFLARASAMRYGRPAQLRIDAANGRFWVQVDTTVAGSGNLDTVGPVHRMGDASITMTSTRSTLCFDRRGLAYYFAGTCDSANAVITFTLSGRTDTVQTTAIGKIIR